MKRLNGTIQKAEATIRLPESFKIAMCDEANPNEFWDAVRTVKRDVLAGVEKFTKLAEAGSTLSMYMLGDIYFWSYKGLRQGELGMKWLKYAAERGSIEGAYQLGRAYKALKDEDAYIATFSALSDRGFSPAMFNLGAAYDRAKNLEMSEAYYRRGSNAHNYHARKNLIIMMVQGRLGLSEIPSGLFLWAKILPDFSKLIAQYPESDSFRGSPVRIMGSGIDPVLRASLLLIGPQGQ